MTRRIVLAMCVIASMAIVSSPATAAPAGPLPGFEVIDDRDSAGSSEGAMALYHGQTIDLGDGWDGASVCAVVTAEDIRCYDSEQELREGVGASGPGDVTVQSLSDCAFGWACIWEFVNFEGRKLQFNDPGGNQGLGQYGFRDQTSSLYNNLPNGYYFTITDYRTNLPDPYLVYIWSGYGSDLRNEPYPGGVYGGGNWNNKVDAIRVSIS